MQPLLRPRRRIERDLRPHAKLDYGRLSDPILVTRANDGDRVALAALCERYAPRVARIAMHELGDPEDAGDAAQDALAKLCTRLEQFRGEASFPTWLHRLTVNCCRDVADRRRRRRWEPLEHDLRESNDVGPSRAAELAELRAELRDALSSLPAAQAKVLVLKDGLDLSFGEISTAAGVPVGTAKCYAHRGRAGLRRRLAGGGAVS